MKQPCLKGCNHKKSRFPMMENGSGINLQRGLIYRIRRIIKPSIEFKTRGWISGGAAVI